MRRFYRFGFVLALFWIHAPLRAHESGIVASQETAGATQQGAQPAVQAALFAPVPLPEQKDRVYKMFTARHKRVLVIAASRYPDAKDNVPFVEPSARRVRDALMNRGYEELQAPLIGSSAGKEEIKQALLKIRTLNENYSVVIYYAGHGVIDEDAATHRREVWLQTASEPVESKNGLSVSEVFDLARGYDNGRAIFQGRIVLIIDSCYSGQAPMSAAFFEQQNDKRAVLFTSSDFKEPSQKYVSKDDHEEMTAFAYFFQRALTSDWDKAETEGNGCLTYYKLWLYVKTSLKEAYDAGDIKEPMTPDLRDLSNVTLVAYDRTKRQKWEDDNVTKNVWAMTIDFVRKGGSGATPSRAAQLRDQIRRLIVRLGNDDLTGISQLDAQASPHIELDFQLPENKAKTLKVEFLDANGRVIDTKGLTLTEGQKSQSIRDLALQLQTDVFAAHAGRVSADIQARVDRRTANE